LLEEPLRASAPLARLLSLEWCRGCGWLHGFWQCLRILALAADPPRHAQFYDEALGAACTSGGPLRLLVCGAADYSMLAHALAACRARGIEPQIAVIDTCETPLRLNRWYAERVGCRITTKRRSVLDYAPPAPFDVVCTHSFFAMFRPVERPRLIDSWRRLLRPGGRLVTANALRPWGPDEPNRFSAEQARSFQAAVAAGATGLAELLGSSDRQVMQQAEQYLGARYGYAVRSLGELRALFEQGGFGLEHLEPFAPAAGGPRELGGPGLRDSKVRYAHITATRS
jgi:SAM-dependent methyltransferase